MKYLLVIFLSIFFSIGCEKKEDKKANKDVTYCHFIIQDHDDEFIKLLNQEINSLEYFKKINHSNPEIMSKNLYGKNMEQYTRINSTFNIVWFKFYNGIDDADNTNKYLVEWSGIVGSSITWNDCDDEGVKQSYFIGNNGIEKNVYPLDYKFMMEAAILHNDKTSPRGFNVDGSIDEKDYKILLHMVEEAKDDKVIELGEFVIVFNKNQSFFGNGKLTVINNEVRQLQYDTYMLIDKPSKNFNCDVHGHEPVELFEKVDSLQSKNDIYLSNYFGKETKAVTILLLPNSYDYYFYVVMDTKSKKYKVFRNDECGLLPKELL